ncbi:hypothetical protein C6499_19325 [Candidatus Poribacteria bacterium]|nr:MAG: hypothetical protein C6499_19325 [Candidatus Poribacteria bacterium]
MGRFPKGATEDYKLGYKDGIKAGDASGEGVLAGMIAGFLCMPHSGNLFAPSKLPETVKQNIQGQSDEYQNGFTNGWVQGVSCDADFYSLLYDWLWCESDDD